jgi:phasin family protein
MNTPQQEYAADAPQSAQPVLASLTDVADKAISGVERFARLNLQTLRTSLAEQQALAQSMLDAQSPEIVFIWQSAQAQAALAKSFSYWSHMTRIHVETLADTAASGLQTLAACTQRVESTWGALNRAAAGQKKGLPAVLPSTALIDPAGHSEDGPGGTSRRKVQIVDGDGKVVSSVSTEKTNGAGTEGS